MIPRSSVSSEGGEAISVSGGGVSEIISSARTAKGSVIWLIIIIMMKRNFVCSFNLFCVMSWF